MLHRVAEEVWRLERRLERVAVQVGDDPLDSVRDALQRLKDLLDESGVRALDHDGERYMEGVRLDVLHVEGEPTEDSPLCVIRTVRPTILADGQVVASGQVILGPVDLETPPQ